MSKPMIFRHYPSGRPLYGRSPGIWRGGYMFCGPRGNWILHGFQCKDCGGLVQWYAWRWWGLPGKGPFLGPSKTRKALIDAILKRDKPALSLVRP